MGLGLYIVDHIVQAHGGGIAVDSQHGETSFQVTLPRVQTAEIAALLGAAERT